MMSLVGNTPDDFSDLKLTENLAAHQNDDGLNWFSATARLLFCNEFHTGVKSLIISHDFCTKTNRIDR